MNDFIRSYIENIVVCKWAAEAMYGQSDNSTIIPMPSIDDVDNDIDDANDVTLNARCRFCGTLFAGKESRCTNCNAPR